MSDRQARPSSVRKQQAIVDSAIDVFLHRGFDDAGMDEIAAAAGVSKQTIYTHFGGKQQLFVAVMATATAGAFERAHPEVEDPTDATALEAYLYSYGTGLMEVVLNDRLLALRRLAIAEARRFPDIAAAFVQGGPAAATTEMAHRLVRFQDAGLLGTFDVLTAARTFNWLLLGAALNAAMFDTRLAIPSPEERSQIAQEAVRVFLAAYR